MIIGKHLQILRTCTTATIFVKQRIERAIEKIRILNKKKTKKKKRAKKNNLYRLDQELLRAKAYSMTNEIDDFINDFEMTSGALKSFKPLSLLRKVQAKANHAKIIKELYEGCYRI